MKILLANKFFFQKGGSEASFFRTARLLKENGHEVIFFSMIHPENVDVPCKGSFVSRVEFESSQKLRDRIRAAGRILYSFEAKRKIEALLRKEKPDLVHLHNIHHQISPSILPVIKRHKIPVVMTLHDYKMVCPVYTLTRNGRVCEKCAFGKFYSCLLHRCCKNSILKSSLNTLEMYFHHNFLNIYGMVDAFISPSRFLKEKSVEMGFEKRVFHLPNFIDCDQFSPFYGAADGNLIYFGRLSKEKGLCTLLAAVKGLKLKCKIYGEGPLKSDLERKITEESLSNVSLMGHIPLQELKSAIKESMFVVLPSEWYENNPFSVLEAFALGKPVIGARIGGIPELVQNFKTGLLFDSGNVDSLKQKIMDLSENLDERVKMGKKARQFVKENFNPEKYYSELMQIYEKAVRLSSC